MKQSKALIAGILSLSLVVLTSCNQEQAESEIARDITMTVTKKALVLPNNLVNIEDQPPATCVSGGVTGPRVRLRVALQWNGLGDSNNVLVPLALTLSIGKDARFDSDYSSNLSPSGSSESLSILFGETTNDYILPSGSAYASSVCYGDYGSLPKPATPLSGSSEVVVNVTLKLLGVMRNLNNSSIEVPFVKEVRTQIVYTEGSIPAS